MDAMSLKLMGTILFTRVIQTIYKYANWKGITLSRKKRGVRRGLNGNFFVVTASGSDHYKV